MTLTQIKKTARAAAFERRATAHGRGLDGPAQERLTEVLAAHRGRPLAGSASEAKPAREGFYLNIEPSVVACGSSATTCESSHGNRSDRSAAS